MVGYKYLKFRKVEMQVQTSNWPYKYKLTLAKNKIALLEVKSLLKLVRVLIMLKILHNILIRLSARFRIRQSVKISEKNKKLNIS